MTDDDEYTCAQILFDLRFPDGWSCDRCGHRGCAHLRCRPRCFECNRCHHRFSVTAGTSLHRCRIPLVKVIAAACLLASRRSISARQLASILDLSHEAAWSLGHRLRSGVLRQELKLEGEVVLSSRLVRSRPPPRVRGRFGRRFVPVKVLWDRSLRLAAQTGRSETHSLRRFVDRHSAVERPHVATLFAGFDPAEVVNGVHRGVSERWLPFYAASLVRWHNGRITHGDTVRETLAGVVAQPLHPFARLRPHPPPRHVTEWDHGNGWLEVLRAWGRLPPAPPPEPSRPG